MITPTAEIYMINDLKESIGKEFPDDQSSTLRSKLISVEKGYCITKEIASRWGASREPSQEAKRRSYRVVWDLIHF